MVDDPAQVAAMKAARIVSIVCFAVASLPGALFDVIAVGETIEHDQIDHVVSC